MYYQFVLPLLAQPHWALKGSLPQWAGHHELALSAGGRLGGWSPCWALKGLLPQWAGHSELTLSAGGLGGWSTGCEAVPTAHGDESSPAPKPETEMNA